MGGTTGWAHVRLGAVAALSLARGGRSTGSTGTASAGQDAGGRKDRQRQHDYRKLGDGESHDERVIKTKLVEVRVGDLLEGRADEFTSNTQAPLYSKFSCGANSRNYSSGSMRGKKMSIVPPLGHGGANIKFPRFRGLRRPEVPRF